jgi:hypothetical protein
MKIPSVAAEFFHADWWTDITKLIVAFRNFANAPKSCTVKLLFYPIVLRYPKEHFFKHFQPLPLCPWNKRNIKMTVSVRLKWNDTDKRRPKHVLSESGLCRCHFVHHNSHGFSRDMARELAAISRRLSASVVIRSQSIKTS